MISSACNMKHRSDLSSSFPYILVEILHSYSPKITFSTLNQFVFLPYFLTTSLVYELKGICKVLGKNDTSKIHKIHKDFWTISSLYGYSSVTKCSNISNDIHSIFYLYIYIKIIYTYKLYQYIIYIIHILLYIYYILLHILYIYYMY